MPSWLFWIYTRQLPILHARESIHRINEFAFASGSTKEDEGNVFIQELNRLAAGSTSDPIKGATRPSSPEELMALMGGTGQAMEIG